MNERVFASPIVVSLRPLVASNTLFLDRDGVLNHVVMRASKISSPRCTSEFKLYDDISLLSQDKIKQDWNLVIVTNQPDLSRGWIEMKLLNSFHSQISEHISINAIYICPHVSSDNCGCRKPACGLIDLFRRENSHVNGKEFFIGDRDVDQACAQKANVPFILRRNDYNGELVSSAYAAVHDLSEIDQLLI